MATKIQVNHNSVEGGNKSWFIATGDFSSLEARLAAVDTVLNDQGLDPVLFEVYKDGSKTSDLHSMTGYNTFCKGRKAIRVHDDVDNKDYVFDILSNVKVLRNGQEMKIKASELIETDHIIEALAK